MVSRPENLGFTPDNLLKLNVNPQISVEMGRALGEADHKAFHGKVSPQGVH